MYTAHFLGIPIVTPTAVKTVAAETVVEQTEQVEEKPKTEITETEPVNETPVEAEPVTERGTMPDETDELQPEQRKSNPLPAFMGIIALMGIIGGCAYFYLQKNKTETEVDAGELDSAESAPAQDIETEAIDGLYSEEEAAIRTETEHNSTPKKPRRKKWRNPKPRALSVMLIMVMSLSIYAPVFAYNYQYESGPDTKATFGVPTQTDAAAYNPESENVRRNKDAAFMPPPYGIFSGDIPTDASSPYHDNSRTGRASDITNYAVETSEVYGGSLSATSGVSPGGGSMSDTGVLPSTSVMPSVTYNTLPLYYDDGSIGSVYIPKLKRTVKVYEGETLENMRRGAGHFEFSSVWDGNVGLASHNRGSAGYFEGIKNLSNGDKIEYTTKYGTRTYSVFLKEKISDTDYSYLGWTSDNTLSLITCVEGVSDQRWIVQAREVK